MKTSTVVSVLLAGVLMMGCSEEKPGYDTGSDDPEEVVAIKGFYQSIYRDDNLQQAKMFASNRMDGLIDHYASLNSVERYVLGRYYDKVELMVELDSLVPYLNNSKEVRATVMFDGEYQGENVKDSRDVVLVMEDGHWRVDQILDQRYRP